MTLIPWIGLILLLIYEIWALKNDKPEDTITAIVQRQRPLVPFVFGILMGHFFW